VPLQLIYMICHLILVRKHVQNKSGDKRDMIKSPDLISTLTCKQWARSWKLNKCLLRDRTKWVVIQQPQRAPRRAQCHYSDHLGQIMADSLSSQLSFIFLPSLACLVCAPERTFNLYFIFVRAPASHNLLAWPRLTHTHTPIAAMTKRVIHGHAA